MFSTYLLPSPNIALAGFVELKKFFSRGSRPPFSERTERGPAERAERGPSERAERGPSERAERGPARAWFASRRKVCTCTNADQATFKVLSKTTSKTNLDCNFFIIHRRFCWDHLQQEPQQLDFLSKAQNINCLVPWPQNRKNLVSYPHEQQAYHHPPLTCKQSFKSDVDQA